MKVYYPYLNREVHVGRMVCRWFMVDVCWVIYMGALVNYNMIDICFKIIVSDWSWTASKVTYEFS